MAKKSVTVYYPGGRASFAPDFIRSFGSLEALQRSDVLARVSCRDKVLEALWVESTAAVEKVPQGGENEPEK